MLEETPSPDMVKSGDSMHYDDGGNAVAVCMRCSKPVDLEFGDYVEVGVTMKHGLNMERPGKRWFWHAGCWVGRG